MSTDPSTGLKINLKILAAGGICTADSCILARVHCPAAPCTGVIKMSAKPATRAGTIYLSHTRGCLMAFVHTAHHVMLYFTFLPATDIAGLPVSEFAVAETFAFSCFGFLTSFLLFMPLAICCPFRVQGGAPEWRRLNLVCSASPVRHLFRPAGHISAKSNRTTRGSCCLATRSATILFTIAIIFQTGKISACR